MGEVAKQEDKKLHFNSVMIIDDDETDLWITERLLLLEVVVKKVYKEKDPLNALALIKGIKNKKDLPEIIILDMKMPGFDGFAFLKEFAKFPKRITSACSVLLLSAYFQLEPELIDQTKNYAFVSKYLNKPLDVKYLYN